MSRFRHVDAPRIHPSPRYPFRVGRLDVVLGHGPPWGVLRWSREYLLGRLVEVIDDVVNARVTLVDERAEGPLVPSATRSEEAAAYESLPSAGALQGQPSFENNVGAFNLRGFGTIDCCER